jgi:hypothetical protein
MKFNKKRNEKKKEDRKKEVAVLEGSKEWYPISNQIVEKWSNIAEKEGRVLTFLSRSNPRLRALVEKELQCRENVRLAPKNESVIIIDDGGEV